MIPLPPCVPSSNSQSPTRRGPLDQARKPRRQGRPPPPLRRPPGPARHPGLSKSRSARAPVLRRQQASRTAPARRRPRRTSDQAPAPARSRRQDPALAAMAGHRRRLQAHGRRHPTTGTRVPRCRRSRRLTRPPVTDEHLRKKRRRYDSRIYALQVGDPRRALSQGAKFAPRADLAVSVDLHRKCAGSRAILISAWVCELADDRTSSSRP